MAAALPPPQSGGVKEGLRRGIVGALLVLAVAGAAGLMASSLLAGPDRLMPLVVVSLAAAVGCGTACTVLAWRWWWSGQ